MFTVFGHRGPSVHGDDDPFLVLGDELRRRGWGARVVRYRVGGEVDVRLRVSRSGSLVVELLGPCGGLPCHERWEAVRIADGRRAVWCGPPHECPQDELTTFLEELLRRDDIHLAGRYTRLG